MDGERAPSNAGENRRTSKKPSKSPCANSCARTRKTWTYSPLILLSDEKSTCPRFGFFSAECVELSSKERFVDQTGFSPQGHF